MIIFIFNDGRIMTFRAVFVLIMACALSLGFLIGSAQANELREIRVQLNEEYLQFAHPPVLEEGVTLVPFRALFEAIDLTVEWDHVNKIAAGEKDGLRLELPIYQPAAIVNDMSIELDHPATLISGHTMVPLRFVSESTGALVLWNGAEREIFIFTKEKIASLGITKEELEARIRDSWGGTDEESPGPVVDSPGNVDPSSLTGMWRGFIPDYGGYNCGGICWVFYTFLDDDRILLDVPELGGPEMIDCSIDTCHSYTVQDGELILDNGERLILAYTEHGDLEINGRFVSKVEPVEDGLKLDGYYRNVGYSGLVSSNPVSSSWSSSIEFNRDGTFTSQDATGTYDIQGNTITFTYSDGTVFQDLFFIHYDDVEDVQIGENNFIVR